MPWAWKHWESALSEIGVLSSDGMHCCGGFCILSFVVQHQRHGWTPCAPQSRLNYTRNCNHHTGIVLNVYRASPWTVVENVISKNVTKHFADLLSFSLNKEIIMCCAWNWGDSHLLTVNTTWSCLHHDHHQFWSIIHLVEWIHVARSADSVCGSHQTDPRQRMANVWLLQQVYCNWFHLSLLQSCSTRSACFISKWSSVESLVVMFFFSSHWNFELV